MEKNLPVVPEADTNQGRKADPRLVLTTFTPTGALLYPGLTADGLLTVEAYARAGHTLGSLEARLGLSSKGFLALRKRCPEVQGAWDLGRSLLDNELTDILLKQARDGNTTAVIFAMKAKLGYRDVGATDPNAGSGPTVNINLTAPMTDDEWTKLVTVNKEE